MNTMTSVSFDILGGPSRGRLFDHIKYLQERTAPNVLINFATHAQSQSNIRTVGYRVTGVEHGNDTGEFFRLKGFCVIGVKNGREERFSQQPFTAEYNTRNRSGKMEVVMLQEATMP